ncbi:DEKNAAC104214 [Brettanomyces naardenensis]|uniref:Calcium-transporting ATPase n=1 Tax=Brettanomyces naardenensis TaxID=13370 RepID=A0A448YQF2_BRENA|nr:DEKNAAC104214 [Brettanomyces naardenensis]
MHDRVLIILSVAAVVSLALGLYETFGQPTVYDAEGYAEPKVEWVEGVAIIVAILIVVLVSAANDYNKERQFTKLNAKKEDRQIVVFRSGQKHFISINDLLVGDIITVETGDVIPADSILVTGSCDCDESSLTGEIDTVQKVPVKTALAGFDPNLPIDIGDRTSTGQRIPDPLLISGSRLLGGQGRALVTAVGTNSMHGKIMMSLRHENENTPLQKRLEGLANGISKYGFMMAVILFVVLFIKFLAQLGGNYKPLSGADKASKFLNIVITAITIVVVAIPEGLPLAVTLALAFATTRMTKDGNLVRVLKSCETMGSATAICSDKTGTLTENKMKVVRGIIGTDRFDDAADRQVASYEESTDVVKRTPKKLADAITENILLNSTAFEGDNADEPFVGSKTECALLLMARDSFHAINVPLQSIRDANEKFIVQTIPFESSRKWGGLVVKKGKGNYRFYIKGASEMVFSRCGSRSLSDGSIKTIDAAAQKEVYDEITSMAEDALRTLSLAHRDFQGLTSWPPYELKSAKNPAEADVEKLFGVEISVGEGEEVTEEKELIAEDVEAEPVPSIVINGSAGSTTASLCLDAVVGIKDPLRAGVREAIEQCRKAGVSVRMVTGDNILTARAISRNCGILPEELVDDPDSCMDGPVFRKLTDSQRTLVVPKLRVLARSSPEDKRILVETLKRLGEVVAVTGDGTNDAPALKLADVGFSMGISGTEVAREASDIILMTDDFASIVNAIKWGRTVSTSIRKFVQFQLTVNITACVLTFVSAVASADGTSVLTAVQLLWVNLIMDTLAALALATDKPDSAVLDRKPMGRNAPLITTSMWKMILGQSTMQLIVTMVIHFRGDQLFFGSVTTSHQRKQIDSLTFNTFVWLQVFKLFVTRKLDEGDGLTRVRDRISRANLDFLQHLFRNFYFIGIELVISGFQVLIMFIGGAAFSIARQTGGMWATALICGLVSFPVGWLIRITPDIWVERIFPTRAFKKFLDFAEFGPVRRIFRKKKVRDEETAVGEPVGSKEQVLNVPDHKHSFFSRSRSVSSSTNGSSTTVSDTLVRSSFSSFKLGD